MKPIAVCLVLSTIVPACAATGTRPEDMSAAQHEAAAQREQQQAKQHEREQALAPASRTVDCGLGCWTSVTSPTPEHRENAARHRELAAKHRAASAALVDAEARACTGVSGADRDMSPFAHREDILSVSALRRSGEEFEYGKGPDALEGATVVFRALPGMTVEWLQRVVDCHIARAAAVGHEMPEMSYCPLMLKGVTAEVTSARGGFAVHIKGPDSKTADEVLKRAEALRP